MTSDGFVSIWNSSGARISAFGEPSQRYLEGIFTPIRETVLTGDSSGKGILWDFEKGKMIRTVTDGFIMGIFSYDGDRGWPR